MVLDDSQSMNDEIHNVEINLYQLRDWFNDPHRDPKFNHAKLEAKIQFSLSGLMGPGPTLTKAQAARIGELHSNFRVLQDLVTKRRLDA